MHLMYMYTASVNPACRGSFNIHCIYVCCQLSADEVVYIKRTEHIIQINNTRKQPHKWQSYERRCSHPFRRLLKPILAISMYAACQKMFHSFS